MHCGVTIFPTDYSISPVARRMAEDAGREPGDLEVTIFGLGPKIQDAAPYVEKGADRLVFALPPAGEEQVLPLLDRYRELAESLA